MSFVYIPYSSISTLISQIHATDPLPAPPNKGDLGIQPNFVLIDPKLYHGTYGGLVYDTILKYWCSSRYLASSIGYGSSIVWWNITNPKACGDLYALSTFDEKYVLVTPEIFRQLIPL